MKVHFWISGLPANLEMITYIYINSDLHRILETFKIFKTFKIFRILESFIDNNFDMYASKFEII